MNTWNFITKKAGIILIYAAGLMILMLQLRSLMA